MLGAGAGCSAGLDCGKQGVREPQCQGTWRERWPYLQKPPGAQSGDSLSTNGKEREQGARGLQFVPQSCVQEA